MDNKILFYDGHNEVRHLETNEIVFKTNQIKDITVIDHVIYLWNLNNGDYTCLGSDGDIDAYLLDEYKCSQEEREFIIGSLYNYFYPLN